MYVKGREWETRITCVLSTWVEVANMGTLCPPCQKHNNKLKKVA
jgi:hypothetical protein